MWSTRSLKAVYALLTVVFLCLLAAMVLGTIWGLLAPNSLAGLATLVGVAAILLALVAWNVGLRLGLSRANAAGLAAATLFAWTSPLALLWVLLKRAPPPPSGAALR